MKLKSFDNISSNYYQESILYHGLLLLCMDILYIYRYDIFAYIMMGLAPYVVMQGRVD